MSEEPAIHLARFRNPQFDRARPKWFEAIWMVTQALFVSSRLPGSAHRRLLLKMFGARIGVGVVIKPNVRIKFPWRLEVSDHSWIGEDVWIDNLALVKIGSNACISQSAYLCTGSHDWSSITFDLIVKPITIGDGAWIAARSTVGPGVTVGEGAVLGLGSTASKDLDPWSIYSGAPAEFVKKRVLKPAESV
ncbi:MAG: putative colanic acid biosynthesis acetyltransferase [Porphyrobacter sp.]|nr:putative colanic acid biosynthesis acetyltransferase [Porphyrobacter sp.]